MLATPLIVDLLILVFLLALSAFFASSETAILSLSKAKVKRLVDLNKMNAHYLFEIKKNPQRILITILIANNLVNVTAASIAAALALEIFPQEIGLALSAGLVTFFILVFGEITPKSIALAHNESIALKAAPFLKFFSILLSPLIFLLEVITGFIAGIFGSDIKTEMVSEEEIKAAVSLSAEEGSILKEEKEMIQKVFELNDIQVKEIMTPKEKISGLKAGTLAKDIAKDILKEHSRMPIYRKNLDDIIGVFYVRDYFGSAIESDKLLPVEKFMRKALFVEEKTKIDSILKEFQKKKVQLAIVIDHRGRTSGLVTIEDILAEIVGEIAEGK
ncbi:MAG TPA: hemolysin family protein [archaeon]|nr:hemolysin family protein [archaeon]